MQKIKKYTVITGASSGIGYETAKAFAARGSNLILTARRAERLENLREEILLRYPALDVVVIPMDLADSDNAYQFYEMVRSYQLQNWINNAGFGNYANVGQQNLKKIGRMLKLNITALTLLSSLFVGDFRDYENTQLINVSSCGGYMLVPNAVTYCAAKFYVSAFTEGLAWELKTTGAKIQAKVLAPAATKTEFGQIANDVAVYDYDAAFGRYHTSAQMADFLLQLYDSNKTVGWVDRKTLAFHLSEPLLPYAGDSQYNQKI